MNKIISKVSAFSLLIGVSVSSWAMGPCYPIAKACMQTGSYQNKQTMIKECVMPVAMGSKTLPGVTISDSQRQQCKETIAQKMKSKMQQGR